MKFRKITSVVLVGLLALAMPVQALAETYYLEDGSVVVTTDETDRYVSQGGGGAVKQETETIITQHNAETATKSTITIDTSGGKAAEVTIENVKIEVSSGSAIEVGDSSATITVEGKNTVKATDGHSAAIHVSGGDLTLTGGEGDSLEAESERGDGLATGSASAIGSNGGHTDAGSPIKEAMSGSITITGDGLSVNAPNKSMGAAIGSGLQGDMTGTITVSGTGTKVTATNESSGAGIGSGSSGDMTGKIILGGENTEITAQGSSFYDSYEKKTYSGANIGAGYRGIKGEFQDTASVTIQGTAQVNASVIGASPDQTEMKGTVTVASTATLNGKQYQYGDTLPDTIRGASVKLDAPAPEPPATEPTQPAEPSAPVEPTEPEKPTEPAGPETPALPETPEAPETPETPEVSEPSEPSEPANPSGAGQTQPTPAGQYWVLNGDGKWAASQSVREGDTLTVTMAEENASFTATRVALLELQKQGVKTVVFATPGKTSQFDVAEALAALPAGKLVLTHRGGEAELTLDGAVSSELLK